MDTLTTTLGALVDAEAALTRVGAVKFDKDGGAKVRYHVAKLARLVAVETKHFHDERNALIETLDRPDVRTAYVGGCPNVYWQRNAGYWIGVAGGYVPAGTRQIAWSIARSPYWADNYGLYAPSETRTMIFQ